MKKIFLSLLFSIFAHASVIEISDARQLQSELKSADSLIFVDCYSTGCLPCRQLQPLFEKWALKYSDKAKFIKANLDVASTLPEKYQISSMPTLLIFDKKGNLQGRKVGLQEIARYFQNFHP